MSRRSSKKTALSEAKKPPSTIDVKAVEDEEDEPTPRPAAETGDEPTAAYDPALVPSCGWGGRLTQDEFFEFAPKYPSKKSVTYYIYRLDPPIDRTRTLGPDAETNIEKILGQTLDYARLRNTWGSGKYHIRMKDTSFRPAARQQVCDTLVEIDEYTEFPPVMDYRELVDNQKNASYISGLMAKKILFRDEQGVLRVTPQGQPGAATAATNGDGTSIANKALEMAERAMNRGSSKVEESAGVAAIQTMSTAFGTMLKTVMEGTGGKDNASGPMILGLFQMIQKQNDTMLEIVRNQGNGGAPAGGKSTIRELISEVTTLFEAAERMGFTRAGGEGQQPWWQALLTALGPGLFSMIQQNAARTGTPAPAASSPALPPPRPAAAPTATATPAGGIPATPAPAADASSEPPVMQMPGPMTRDELFWLSNQVFKQLQRGISGYEFAKTVDISQDFATYARIRNAVKSGLVLEMMQTETEIIARFAPFLEQLQSFMEDFVSYGDEEDDAGAGRPNGIGESSRTATDAVAATPS